jgi:thiol-disulfide isomerase/thioredoxin
MRSDEPRSDGQRSDGQRSDKRRSVLRGLAALGLLNCAGLAVARDPAYVLRVGTPAPPATLTTLDGERIATADLRGRVVILTFWATWCAPCREELPLLSAYAAKHRADGLVVLGFSLDGADELAAVRAIARDLSFPVGLVGSDRLPGYGRLWRMPVNFTIARDGTLADNGWDDKQPAWTPDRLERVVAPLLASQ